VTRDEPQHATRIMADLGALLQASLSPASRKQAEHTLHALPSEPGFLPHLLNLVLDQSKDWAVRLAGGIYLKNLAKHRWDEVNAQFSVMVFTAV
jgi:exportin-2 (importin alpha re-exporter)